MTGLIRSKKFDKNQIKQDIISNVKILYRRSIEEANPMEVYQAVSLTMQKLIIDDWMKTQKAYEEKDVKTVYYLSMEFLVFLVRLFKYSAKLRGSHNEVPGCRRK